MARCTKKGIPWKWKSQRWNLSVGDVKAFVIRKSASSRSVDCSSGKSLNDHVGLVHVGAKSCLPIRLHFFKVLGDHKDDTNISSMKSEIQSIDDLLGAL